MSGRVHITNEKGLRILWLDHPPVNALSSDLRLGLLTAITDAASDDSVKALALIGKSDKFCAGADIKAFGGGPQHPRIPELAEALEGMGKPSVALIDGFALGGGLELALGCTARIATHRARIGLPEIEIGIFPSGGGLQRLPRLIEFNAALDLIISGRKIGAAEAAELGIVDLCVKPENLITTVHKVLARDDITCRLPVTSTSIADTPSNRDALENARKRFTRSGRILSSQQTILDRLEQSLGQPYAVEIKVDAEVSRALLQSPQSKALRHLFSAERKAGRSAEDLPAVDVPRTVGIAGGGTMGGGIALATAQAGIRVALFDPDEGARQRLKKRISAFRDGQLAKGRISATEGNAFVNRIAIVDTLEGLCNAELVIEAVIEDLSVKQALFTRLQDICALECVFASNTSYLDLDAMAATLSRPERLIGLHFFSPAEVMPLLEIVKGGLSSDWAFATGAAYSRKLGKRGVLMSACPGFAANRSRFPMMNEARLLLEDGASPVQVDRVFRTFGFPMGPFETNDLTGLDILVKGHAFIPAELRPGRQSELPFAMVDAGRIGQKANKGWYRYEEGNRKPIADPDLEQLLNAFREEKRIISRKFSDEEVLQRCLYAAVNEAGRVVLEGVVTRPGDMDVIWVNGFGFPREKGGILHWSYGIGFAEIAEIIDRDFRPEDPARWPVCDFSSLGEIIGIVK